ncbi:MAG: isopentenyl-diphosphate Delta-isomerase [Candidatus Woesearchaeota archaeon]
MKSKDYVVLVDTNNKKIGVEEKLKAHQDAKLHRAFSILIFNSKGELLIQQRAKEKYHCGGLWANTVCSHPKPNETYNQATHRRLKEEMGFDCRLKKIFCFKYKITFDNGLTENEYDCVFRGKFDGTPKPNPAEIMDYRWISIRDLKKDIKNYPERYTEWFKIVLKRI